MKAIFNYVCLLVGLSFTTACSCSKENSFRSEGSEIVSTYGTRVISGIYPHLTTYSHGRVNGKYGFGNECGIGALAVWGDKLYMVNYAAHQPKGSEHKLYIIDKDKNMSIYKGSVGGTPAARMIHAESKQLLIGHYLIDENSNIRTIPIEKMPGRITAIARHLDDPKNKVYYYDMEGMLYEANINTLEVKKLFHNPLPGWHGKGAYTSQNRLVLANNGESNGGHEPKKYWKVPTEGIEGKEKNGILAEFDGKNFKVIERRQYTDVTTHNGINAVPDEQSPLWAMGWDKRSIRLKVLDNGKWYTYLLPKAAYNNDPSHGWFTEWPRIREIGNGEMMMDMHGMFFDFPSTFSATNTAGIRPISSHLRYIPDFCSWNGQIVLATDESSIQGNLLTGQPQSNLWFGTKEDLHNWGPASGYGAIWLNDEIAKDSISDPYLFAGFDNKIAHLINHGNKASTIMIQVDAEGNGKWENYKKMTVDGGQYKYLIFPNNVKAEWIRLKSISGGNLSFVLHYTTGKYVDGSKFSSMFDAIADVNTTEDILKAKLYTNRNNYNMSCFTSVSNSGKTMSKNEYEFDKFNFKFIPGINDSLAYRALETKVHYSKNHQFEAKEVSKDKLKELWSVDNASVILHTSKGNLRLPKGNKVFNNVSDARSVREVESERELANIHGTFYELPLSHVGKEPLFYMMRPVASHNKLIDDYNTWNGLLVISGIKKSAEQTNNVYKNDDNTAGLWFGGIDDLWKLGKPVGTGGPWMNTDVAAEEMSDPYLMTGYDKKTLEIYADKDVKATLWLNVSHYLDKPVKYKVFSLKAGEKLKYVFPEGFSAHWASFTVDKDCKATAQFIYE